MGRVDAGQRLRRLLAILAWLARRERVPVAELAHRFGVGPEELIADLELAACCGLPPYTPDQLMEILIDGDEVVAHLGPELARPRKLSAAEGFALAASARAIVAVPGGDPDGALARALAKLDAVLGERDRLRVELDEPPSLADVRAALSAGLQIEIDYHSASRDELTTRRVDPHAAVFLDGNWYLDGYCHRAGSLRRFRIDRVNALRTTGQALCHPAGPTDPPSSDTPFVPGPDNVVVRVAVDEWGSWLADAVPTLAVGPSPDGRTEVTLAVASPVWFGRLLVGLGPHAEVLDSPELAAAGAEMARRVLARYQDSPSG